MAARVRCIYVDVTTGDGDVLSTGGFQPGVAAACCTELAAGSHEPAIISATRRDPTTFDRGAAGVRSSGAPRKLRASRARAKLDRERGQQTRQQSGRGSRDVAFHSQGKRTGADRRWNGLRDAVIRSAPATDGNASARASARGLRPLEHHLHADFRTPNPGPESVGIHERSSAFRCRTPDRAANL